MQDFKFKKINDRFKWESNFMVLEFSDPSIQGFYDYISLESEKQIMYYYYNIRILKKILHLDWDENDNEKEIVRKRMVSNRWTHDFPTILQLKWILEEQLKDDTRINGQKIEYRSGKVRYSKVMSTEGFACDDFYEITKIVDENGKNESYIFYCGTTFDLQGDLNSSGIRTPYVERSDLEELLKCVSSFIEYSLNEHNKEIENWKKVYELKYNKIYEYYFKGKTVNKNKVEAIYSIGDTLDIKTVVNNKEYDYDNVKISKVDVDTIILENGSIINFNSIVYISNEPTNEMLKYKEEEIAKEFLSILSEEEKQEFKKHSVNSLLDKYKLAIIHRTWMCREEHDFSGLDTEKVDSVDKVNPIVEKVINLIKLSLSC